ncbi:hypothetical protein C8R46DRAFT_1362872 [Mycena filopes]|nr:hypothetical protein C8R46DRAFT_1362872 [Mycena filopes]
MPRVPISTSVYSMPSRTRSCKELVRRPPSPAGHSGHRITIAVAFSLSSEEERGQPRECVGAGVAVRERQYSSAPSWSSSSAPGSAVVPPSHLILALEHPPPMRKRRIGTGPYQYRPHSSSSQPTPTTVATRHAASAQAAQEHTFPPPTSAFVVAVPRQRTILPISSSTVPAAAHFLVTRFPHRVRTSSSYVVIVGPSMRLIHSSPHPPPPISSSRNAFPAPTTHRVAPGPTSTPDPVPSFLPLPRARSHIRDRHDKQTSSGGVRMVAIPQAPPATKKDGRSGRGMLVTVPTRRKAEARRQSRVSVSVSANANAVTQLASMLHRKEDV